MNDYVVLTDEHVREWLPMAVAVEKMEDAFREMAAGTLAAPPRFRVEGGEGDLVFTAGAATGPEGVIGFRVYDTFPERATSAEQKQLVAVYDVQDGRFKGVIIGRLLGSMRTGGIGGVAVKHLSRPDSKILGVIGTGYQARTQVMAALAVREIEQVQLYNRTKARAEQFAAWVEETHDTAVRVVESAREAVAGADIVICATNSGTPVIESGWLEPGVHVNNIGPKLAGRHELPTDVADVCDLIVTDSPAQVEGYRQPFYLPPLIMTSLDQIVVGDAPGRVLAGARTLFCSVGLAGTEVVLANALIELVSGG
jgi:ornithine cyclodeaminase